MSTSLRGLQTILGFAARAPLTFPSDRSLNSRLAYGWAGQDAATSGIYVFSYFRAAEKPYHVSLRAPFTGSVS